jgi:hypothetical protein
MGHPLDGQRSANIEGLIYLLTFGFAMINYFLTAIYQF